MVRKDSFGIEISDRADGESKLHPEIELIFVIEGSLEISVENRLSKLDAEDVFVVNSNKNHSCRSAGDVLYLRLWVDPVTVREATGKKETVFLCDSSISENNHYHELRKMLKQLLTHFVEAPEYTKYFSFKADCYGIWDRLISHFMINMADVEDVQESDRYEERLRQINEYIEDNYSQDISMKELSEKLFLSNGYLSRFFKKNYGTNFAGYLMNVRVFHAADDLLYTDAPITRIAYNNGFTSAAQFNKAFKKVMEKTPTEFRRDARPKEEPEDSEEHAKELKERLASVVVRGVEPLAPETEVQRKLSGSFPATEGERLSPYWGKIINFGHAINLLDSDVREHLLLLRQALNFEYVRFWSLFSEALYIRPGEQRYNFSYVDSVLDFVVEQGMKPYIDLGMKPRLLYYGVGKAETLTYLDGGGRQIERFTPSQWERLFRSFMQHLGNRYGQEQLEDWYFEFWYDEEWRNEEKGDERYLEYYCIAWNILKKYNSKIRFGGYGIRMDFGAKERLEFLKKWKRCGCPPDFISVMFYSYERGEDGLDIYAKRTTDNEAMLHMVSREKQMIVDAGFGDTPVHLNEWNLTPSVRNFINDSSFKGAYIVKNVIDMYGLVDEMGYGAGTDRSYASFDTPNILFGGTGLMSRDGILKPAAFAYDFLGHLLPNIVGKGGNFLVTTDGHDNFALLCHNQQQLNYNYYLVAEREIERDNLWRYFEGRNRVETDITLTDVKPGYYRIKIYRVNEEHGNVLKLWKDLSYENELSRNDIRYLRRVCEPQLTIKMVKSDGTIRIREELMPNEIALIRVLHTNEMELYE